MSPVKRYDTNGYNLHVLGNARNRRTDRKPEGLSNSISLLVSSNRPKEACYASSLGLKQGIQSHRATLCLLDQILRFMSLHSQRTDLFLFQIC